MQYNICILDTTQLKVKETKQMNRDNKGRFCKANKIENKEEYQKKLKEAIKLILDCTTKEKIDNACFSYVVNYTDRKNGYGFLIDDITYADLSDMYYNLNK